MPASKPKIQKRKISKCNDLHSCSLFSRRKKLPIRSNLHQTKGGTILEYWRMFEYRTCITNHIILITTILYSKNAWISSVFRIFNVFCKLCPKFMSTLLCQLSEPEALAPLSFSTIFQDIGSTQLYQTLNIVLQEMIQYFTTR